MLPPRYNKIDKDIKGQLPQDRKKTQMGDIFNQAKRAHNYRYIQQRPIEKNQEQAKTNHLQTRLSQRCGRIHIDNDSKSKQDMDGMQGIPLSDFIKQTRF
jgi:hypothetical protein